MDLFLQSIVKMSCKAPFSKVTIKALIVLLFFIMKLNRHLQIYVEVYEGVFWTRPNRSYHFNFFKGFLSQILHGPFLNVIVSYIVIDRHVLCFIVTKVRHQWPVYLIHPFRIFSKGLEF